MLYDGLGRPLTQYTGYDLTESGYADAGSVADDTILTQTETTYDAAGNVVEVLLRERYHNATGLGGLGSPGVAPNARVTYKAMWQDPLGRVIAAADYGTNGGTALARPSTDPGRLRHGPCYPDAVRQHRLGPDDDRPGGDGHLLQLRRGGPRGAAGPELPDREQLQLLQQQFQFVSSSSRSSSSSGSGSSGGCAASTDANVTIQTAYNADGNVAQVTAVNGATGNQVTQYVYGSTLAESGIASSLLKHAEVYPDSVGGSDQVLFQYNRQGEVTAVTDQNGTVHAYDYDLLGRRVQDCVTTLGTGVDGTVLRIATAYEVRGMVQGVTSYDNPTVGSGNVVNDVQLVYNAFGQLTTDYQ